MATVTKKTFNPKSIASPRRLKRGTQRRVTFTSTIVTSIHVRPTTTNKKSLFTTKDDKERAKRDVFICPDLIEFTRGYRQQQRQLRKAMKKFHDDDSTSHNSSPKTNSCVCLSLARSCDRIACYVQIIIVGQVNSYFSNIKY